MSFMKDFELETYFSKWEFKAKYHMCASDIESMTIKELLALGGQDSTNDFLNLHLGYTETFGSPMLLNEISKLYTNVTTKEIMCFAGAEEGIYIAMKTILTPSDHAIVITPNYQSLETIACSICDVTGVSLDENNDWELDLNQLQEAIRPNTKLIIINFPHNPSGKIIDKITQKNLIEIARTNNCYIFSDEVYRSIERDESKQLPAVADIYEKGLSLCVLSKSYGLPGLRIGWIACKDLELIDKMEKAKHYLSICNSAPSEFLATKALKNKDKIIKKNKQLISNNLEILESFFNKHKKLFDWKTPDGGCIGYPAYLGDDGVESFINQLLQQKGVLLLPASVYKSTLTKTPENRFRIGYGRKNILQGIKEIDEFIDNRS